MKKKTCSKCSMELDDSRVGKYRYCKSCHAEYARLNRAKHSELNDIQRKKANCRSYVHVYVKRGLIKKMPCFICGNLNSEAHHENYDRPLDIIWLCRKHHLEHHKNIENVNKSNK